MKIIMNFLLVKLMIEMIFLKFHLYLFHYADETAIHEAKGYYWKGKWESEPEWDRNRFFYKTVKHKKKGQLKKINCPHMK